MPPYIRSKPTDLGKIFYWVDYNNTVWVSDTDAPKGVTLGVDNKTVSWLAVEGATGYEVGYIEESASVSNGKIVAGKGYKELQEVTGATSYTSPTDLSDKAIVVSSVSKDFKSVSVGAGYGGYAIEGGSSPVSQPVQLSQLQLGQYVKYGRFNGYDLTWQVVKISDGDVMLFATEPLKNTDGTYMSKAFDLAPNAVEPKDSVRTSNGSNNWYYSDMRNWLNSDFYNSVFINKNYIKDTTHDYILANIDRLQATSGTTIHVYTNVFDTAMQNYDSTAYKRNVTDKVYLVSIKELIENIQPTIGTNYYDSSLWYWTRDSYAGDSYSLRAVYINGNFSGTNACNYNGRVRVALNLQSALLSAGTGTHADPYVIE